ncbi:hypothetical protein KP509_30G045000 [Ceratopteris richardii]|uniref:Protein kinase domain-containing protein n=2 Tax=Ceratopteris richardii TaxID=49495 RepID=A0A8T2R1Z5_CERRI|nr:hypothetical protein KP509_30G045000 [Ceratopteris richardii]
MAPEVVQRSEQAFPSDIWSLGCTVLEMLQGRPPWGHLSDIAAAMYKIGCSEESRPMPESISSDAKDFLLHCLRRDPADRWTAAQLLSHPFCQVETEDVCKDESSSPRGILDNFFSSPLNSEITSDSDCASETSEWFRNLDFCNLYAPPHQETVKNASVEPLSPGQRKRKHIDAFSSDELRWITVKRVRCELCRCDVLENQETSGVNRDIKHPGPLYVGYVLVL